MSKLSKSEGVAVGVAVVLALGVFALAGAFVQQRAQGNNIDEQRSEDVFEIALDDETFDTNVVEQTN